MSMFNFALFIWMIIAIGMIAIGSVELGRFKENKRVTRFFLGTGFLILFVATIIAGVV